MTSATLRVIRFQGCLLGAAAGDALGWPQELKGRIIGGQKARDSRHPEAKFSEWSRNAGSRYTGTYVDPVSAGHYSDDTQLICAVARACLEGQNWEARLRDVELPAWRFYQRGGGRAVLNAASSWSRGIAPWQKQTTDRNGQKERSYRQAGGNGVAMRIAPHVLAVASEQFEFGKSDLAHRIISDGLLTHGHPRALVGALAYGAALHAALTAKETLPYGALIEAASAGLIESSQAVACLPQAWGGPSDVEEFASEWDVSNEEMGSLLALIGRSLDMGALSNVEETLTEVGSFDPQIYGAGTVTAAGALYLASRSAARPMSGLLDAAFARKADTDTLASMTGAVLGAIHGIEWLGPLSDVQDAVYLKALGELLLEGKSGSYSSPAVDPERLGRVMQSTLSQGGSPNLRQEFPDGRTYSIMQQIVLQDNPAFGRSLLKLEDGQTVIVDQRLKDEDLPAELRRQSTHHEQRVGDTGKTEAGPRAAVDGPTIPQRGHRLNVNSSNSDINPPYNASDYPKASNNVDHSKVDAQPELVDLLPQELSLFDRRRHRAWVADLANDLNRISKETGYSPALLVADVRFRAAAVRALRIVRESLNDDKSRTLRIAVCNSFIWLPLSTVQVNAFLNLLSRYEFAHVEVLLACADISPTSVEPSGQDNGLMSQVSAVVCNKLPLSPTDVHLIVGELESDGLLTFNPQTPPEQWRILTSLGESFLAYCGIGGREIDDDDLH